MNRCQITVTRASTAFTLRYNLFRPKWHPNLCYAVPEDQPVPSFIAGESWNFAGTWGGTCYLPWDTGGRGAWCAGGSLTNAAALPLSDWSPPKGDWPVEQGFAINPSRFAVVG